MDRSLELQRGLFVSGRVPQLQGLRLLPIAVVCLLASAWNAKLFHLPGDDQPLAPTRWFLIALFVAVAASYPMRGLYKGSWATPRPTRSAVPWIVATVAAMALAGWYQPPQWPISMPMVVLALALAIVGLRKYPLRRHYLWASAVLAASALLKPLGVAQEVRSVLFYAAFGVALIIVGVGDHRLLTTTKLQVPDEENV